MCSIFIQYKFEILGIPSALSSTEGGAVVFCVQLGSVTPTGVTARLFLYNPISFPCESLSCVTTSSAIHGLRNQATGAAEGRLLFYLLDYVRGCWAASRPMESPPEECPGALFAAHHRISYSHLTAMQRTDGSWGNQRLVEMGLRRLPSSFSFQRML